MTAMISLNIPYPKVCLLLVCHLLKLFNATLLDSSECHLHYCDFRHSLNVISFLGGHSMKLISQKFRHLQT